MSLAIPSRRIVLALANSAAAYKWINGVLYRRLRGASGVSLRSASGAPLYGRIA